MGWGGYGYDDWRPYVPVGQRKANAREHASRLAKKQGRQASPVTLEGKKIATTFWGKAWCDNLAAYSDYSNRLPRGATYVRNGSVVDLVIKKRTVEALVAGSETYTIRIDIAPLTKSTWKTIKRDCSASIDSLLDLLAGRLSEGVMQRLTRQKEGLFPSPSEINMDCSCPDWSKCCKHLAAVMYAIGARLDKRPELLFLLRDVDHQELVSQAVAEGNLDKELSAAVDGSLAGQDLSEIFGIELDASALATPQPDPSSSGRQGKIVRPSKAKQVAGKPAASRTKKAIQKPKSPSTISTKAALAEKTAKPAKVKRVAKSTAKSAAAKKSVRTKSLAEDSIPAGKISLKANPAVQNGRRSGS